MALPKVELPRSTVSIDGEDVPIKSLSRSQALEMKKLGEVGDLEGIEVKVVAFGTECSLKEAKAWLAATPAGLVDHLVNAIIRLSGLEVGNGN